MIKLYRKTRDGMDYFETWKDKGVQTVHWGKVGERGQSKEFKETLLRAAAKEVKAQIALKKQEGYRAIPQEDHSFLLIEYSIEGMGSKEDLEKRHRLEARMNDLLGWIGLGHCDGGSIGSGTMEVCCPVVDFDIATRIIAADLRETEFADFKRIYKEEDVQNNDSDILGCFVFGQILEYKDISQQEAEKNNSLFDDYIWGEKGIDKDLKKLKHEDYGKDLLLILFEFNLNPIPERLKHIKEMENYRKNEKSIGIPVIVNDENFFNRSEVERRLFLKNTLLAKLDLLAEKVKKNKLDTDIVKLKMDLESVLAS